MLVTDVNCGTPRW